VSLLNQAVAVGPTSNITPGFPLLDGGVRSDDELASPVDPARGPVVDQVRDDDRRSDEARSCPEVSPVGRLG
jgi:hypothetical protein